MLPNIELMPQIKCFEHCYAVKPTSVTWTVCRHLCRHPFFATSFDGQGWWRLGAAVISTSATTEDSSLCNVLGVLMCEWVVSCGRESRWRVQLAASRSGLLYYHRTRPRCSLTF
jgi:hypothetical protein